MADHEWFEMTDGCVERTKAATFVRDEDGNVMFMLPWRADLKQVEDIKAIADKAYRIGRAVGSNEKVCEMRRVLELPLGSLEKER